MNDLSSVNLIRRVTPVTWLTAAIALALSVIAYSATYLKTDGAAVTMPDSGLKQTQSGSQVLTVLELTKAISFPSAMVSTNYEVFVQPQSNVSATFWASDKTVNGFTINLSAGIVSTISWMAVSN